MSTLFNVLSSYPEVGQNVMEILRRDVCAENIIKHPAEGAVPNSEDMAFFLAVSGELQRMLLPANLRYPFNDALAQARERWSQIVMVPDIHRRLVYQLRRHLGI